MRPVARIAQSVEQGIENPRVLGSIPSPGTLRARGCPLGIERRQRSRREKQQEKFARKSGNTFEDIARKWVAGNIRWNEAHAAKVLRSLELHVFPLIGKFRSLI